MNDAANPYIIRYGYFNLRGRLRPGPRADDTDNLGRWARRMSGSSSGDERSQWLAIAEQCEEWRETKREWRQGELSPYPHSLV